jgi:glycosyltransferase involved in cell wall biosynthesis
MIRHLRARDMAVDPRVDHYFVNSPIIERRLWKYYKRDSEVLYPPVELDRYYNDGDHGYFLHLGRLDEEKGVPEVVASFEGLNERLVMAGGAGDVDSEVLGRIERAGNIEWLGFVDEAEKFELLARCIAVVFNGHSEDFGIVPIEANASGKPVLARNEGFPGLFVTEANGRLHDGTAGSIQRSISELPEKNFTVDPERHVSRFSIDTFSERTRDAIADWHANLQRRVRQ